MLVSRLTICEDELLSLRKYPATVSQHLQLCIRFHRGAKQREAGSQPSEFVACPD
jgi:hypothetical protein